MPILPVHRFRTLIAPHVMGGKLFISNPQPEVIFGKRPKDMVLRAKRPTDAIGPPVWDEKTNKFVPLTHRQERELRREPVLS